MLYVNNPTVVLNDFTPTNQHSVPSVLPEVAI